MKRETKEAAQILGLRKRAEAMLADARGTHAENPNPAELRHIVHELNTYQIELELQNEELRRTQEELLEMRDRFVDLYDYAPIGYVTLSVKGLVLEANLTICDMLRTVRQELIGRRLSSFVASEDQDEYYRYLRACLASQDRITCEIRLRTGPDAQVWARMESGPETEKDGSKGIRVVVQDITETRSVREKLRETEIRYQGLFESMQAGFILYEIMRGDGQRPVDFRVLEVNVAFETHTGLLRNSVVGSTLRTIMPGIEPYWIEALTKVATSGQSIQLENYARDLDRYFEVVGYSPQPDRCALIFLDVTQRRRDQEELRRHRDELDKLVRERTSELEAKANELAHEREKRERIQHEANRAGQLATIGELAAGVAHEINNPINGIINYAQLLIDEFGSEGRPGELAGRITNAGERIAHIVDGLLTFAREKRGESIRVDVRDVLLQVLSLLEEQLSKEHVDIRLNLATELPGVLAHPVELGQVFLNVISNARYALNAKFKTSHPDKILDIETQNTFRDGQPFCRISFRDRGIGIPKAIQERVMDPFFSTKPANQGTGLGLSISHGIVGAHGGSMSIESVEGEFTLVSMWFPAIGEETSE